MNTPPDFSHDALQRPGTERFRPQFHFSPRRNWINDPNGLVWFEGEYHLFFQYNPEGIDWGHMSWGHAVSTDLLHWRELDVAIPETDHMAFSGSVVVDWHNASGLGDGVNPPLLAFYTAFDPVSEIQSQHLAYSHDRGRTFVAYAANPVLDLDATDFRDPKVFWHAESQAWIMAVVLAQRHVVQFYRSVNLRDWLLAGEFTGHGSTSGQWECPDLIKVGVEGEAGQTHWVLKIDVDVGIVAGGSGTQYFVGSFDGFRFVIDPQRGNPDGDLVDCGPDFYAAITWGDLPVDQPGPVWIGWQSNHQSGKTYPTNPWRGAMSLPRRLFLFEEAGQLRLGQYPVAGFDQLAGPHRAQPDVTLNESAHVDIATPGAGFDQQMSLIDLGGAMAEVTIADDGGALLVMDVDFGGGQVTFRRLSSPLHASDAFARTTTTRLPGAHAIDVTVVFDGSLIELFIDGGRRVWSGVVFPQGPVQLAIAAVSGGLRVERMVGRTIEPAIDFGP